MKQPKPQAGRLAFFMDLISGRLHNRVITLTQIVKELTMQQKELENRFRTMGQQMTQDIAAVQQGVQALRDKADTSDVDFTDELATMDTALASLHQTAQSFSTVTSGGPTPSPVPSDVSGISPVEDGLATQGTSLTGAGPGGAVDATAASASSGPGSAVEDEDDEE